VARGDGDAARALIDDAKAEAPVPAAIFEAEGILFEREGKRDEAHASFERALAAPAPDFLVPFRLAELEWSTVPSDAKLKRREQLVTQSIAMNPRYAPAHAMLADTLLAARRYADAVPAAQQAVALDPASATTRLVLARVLWGADRRDEARRALMAADALAADDNERLQVQAVQDMFERLSQSGTPAAPPTGNAGAAR
jgi:tetratricopeptide (TPR) repeat protein